MYACYIHIRIAAAAFRTTPPRGCVVNALTAQGIPSMSTLPLPPHTHAWPHGKSHNNVVKLHRPLPRPFFWQHKAELSCPLPVSLSPPYYFTTGTLDCVRDDAALILRGRGDRGLVRGRRGRTAGIPDLGYPCGAQRARGAGGGPGAPPPRSFQAQHGAMIDVLLGC